MSRESKILLVGWDAADWKVMHRLIDHGLMPHTKRLVENGVTANLATLSPVLSPMLWTSIATGKRPFKHGILGFTEPTPDGTFVRPVTNLSRKTKAIWNILNQNGKRSLVVGWWPSHPVEPIHGVMVSNHYQRAPRSDDPRWPMAPDTVHPTRLAQTLADLRLHPLELTEEHLRPFLPHAEKIDQTKDNRLATVLRTLADCTTIHSCATHLLEHEPWDFAAVYYDAIDHFQHAFMKYHPPRQDWVSEEDFDIYQNVVSAGYVYHDMMLGRLTELAGDETTVILVSDHGFHSDHLRPRAIPHEPAGPAVEHRDFGILVMAGPGIKRDTLVHGANLLDITPTLLTLLGLPVGDDMDGHPLLDVFQETKSVEMIPSWDDVPGETGQHAEDRRLDAMESREALEQLVALGYIERPPENQEKAVAQAVREQNYNLALAYIDAGMQPEAVPLLIDLYRDSPVEFRFGIQLAMCLRTLEMTDEMAQVVDHLNGTWREASRQARERLKEIAKIAKQRRNERKEARDEAESARPATNTVTDAEPEPALFNGEELRVIRTLRAIARGNERTLDYLASSVAAARQDPDAALKYVEAAEESETRTPGFHLQVGNTYFAMKRYQDAERCYQRVLELDPENPNGYVGLCRCYLKRRRNREASEAAAAAVGLKYHFPPAHFFLGISLHRLGDVRAAVESLERAISQNPNFAEAHSRLALIYEKRLHQDNRAKEHRRLAGEIRKERKRQHASRTLPELPLPDAADFDDALHKFPESAEAASLRPPLAAAPVHGDEPVTSTDERPFVVIVSGLPRSGTSMMMQMRAAGGVVPMTDGERHADESNPLGYFELEKVKRLQTDNTWLDEARGKAVKVVAPLTPYLPQDCSYRVVFMERDVDEILASQRRMLQRTGQGNGPLNENQLRRILMRQVQQAEAVFAAHQVPVLTVGHADVLRDAALTARRIADFVQRELDEAAMLAVVNPDLYRERAPNEDS